MSDGRFKPGQSGNPKGRPPKIRTDSTVATPVPSALVRAKLPDTVSRRDGWINDAGGHGTRRDRRTLTRYGVDIVTDIEALQLWRSEFLAATIIEGEPTEALKRGWRFKCEDRELEVAVLKQAEELGLDAAILKAAEYENAYGGAAIFPVLSGSLGDLSEPLDEGGIASVDAFHVFEPQELLPVDYYSDVRLPKFRQPETYRLVPLTNGRSGFLPPTIIHESRLIVFPGTKVSVQTQPGQRQGWGDSILCRPRQVIADFGLSWASAATLLHEHGKGTLAMDGFASMMAQADGLDQFDKYITAMSMAWTTLGMVVIDNKSQYTRSTGTLSGISEMLAEFRTLMAAAAGRPVSKLFGTSQTGLRTGDDDTLSWLAKVESYQSKHLKPRHEKAVRLILLSTAGPANGKEPDAWSVEYPPLQTPSEEEKAGIQLKDMQRAQIAVQNGIASADDVAESFYKGEQYSGDIKINWERREAQAALQQQGAEGVSPEDAAAMGYGGEEQGDLTDDELSQLQALQDEFGTDDGSQPDEDEQPEELDDEEDWENDDEPDREEDEGDEQPDDGEREDEWRDDDMGAAVGPDGKGYNPNRNRNGTFGSGPHKQKPTAGERAHAALGKAQERVGKAKARVEGYAGKIDAATKAKHAALAETREALGKAQAAAELARAKPTAKNIKAAQVATNKATRAQAKVDKHDAAIAKHTQMHAKATTAHAKATEAHAKAHEKANAGKAKEAGQKPPKDAGQKAKAEPAKAEPKAAEKSEAQPAAKAEPKPQPPPATPVEPHAGSVSAEAHAAAAKGDIQGLHQIMDRQLAGMGLQKQGTFSLAGGGMTESQRGTVGVVPRSELSAFGANAFREPTGKIMISEQAVAGIKAYANTLGGRKAADVIGKHSEAESALGQKLQSLSAQRAQTKSQAKKDQIAAERDRLNNEFKAPREELSTLRSGSRDMKMLMHESLHGFSPVHPNSYRGHGAKIEEITTEVAARHMMHQHYGAELIGHDNAGSYSEHIKATTNAMAELTGKPRADAYKQLGDVSMEFKKRTGGSLRSPDAVKSAFAEDMAKAAGTSHAHALSVLSKHLDPTSEATD